MVSCGMENKINENNKISKPLPIRDIVIVNTIDSLKLKFQTPDIERIEMGVRQVADFWTSEDGTDEDFQNFCIENFINDKDELDSAFVTIQKNFEVLNGHFNKISLALKFKQHIDEGEMNPLDLMFGGYEPSSNLQSDLFKNKIAFYILLNFPHYSLDEKNTIGDNWTARQWAYARVGDLFSSRVPADLSLEFGDLNNKCDNYIANYNIYMGNIIDNKTNAKFPEDMKLISHWNLRDEIKSNYNAENGLNKQKMIYTIMKRIINQEIPENVINNKDLKWDPAENKVFQNDKEIQFKPEPDTRYQYMIDNFKMLSAMDKYNPFYQTYIDRKFKEEMEMPFEEVEKIFIELLSSEQSKKIGELIEKRLGRKLEPFDIWYDGFKSRSTISDEHLTKLTSSKYKDNIAFQNDLPNILVKLGFTKEKAMYLADKIVVDASRGAGHAWGAQMKGEKAHLRSRIGKNGMDYKGYNIALHEFGHNVEQTFSLYNVPEYMISGVPNTAFTEAMAFLFQQRDMKVLGLANTNEETEYLHTLDSYWSAFEIMGVSLVDMYAWKWLYDNPNANAKELKENVIRISKEVWNKYYAPIFNSKDEEILGIYSHMISYPLYLAAYPIGHLIEFQLEQNLKDKPFGAEIERMTTIGRVTPKDWMKKAVSNELSPKPLIEMAKKSIEYFSNK